MTSYYQTVPEDDGCSWLLDNPNCPERSNITNTVAVWDEMEETLRNNIDDEIRSLRHRIHHLMDERKMKCDYMLGISGREIYQKSELTDHYEEQVENVQVLECNETQNGFMMPPSSLCSDHSVDVQPTMDHETGSNTSAFTCEFPPSSSQMVSDMNEDPSFMIPSTSDDEQVMRIMKAMLHISNHLNKVFAEKNRFVHPKEDF